MISFFLEHRSWHEHPMEEDEEEEEDGENAGKPFPFVVKYKEGVGR